MDYMEFLNKKSEMARQAQEGQSIGSDAAKHAENNDIESLFSDQSAANQKLDGTSVFNVATQEDLQNMNFEQVVSADEPEESNALVSLFRNFFSFDAVKKDADKNGDGELSADEAKEYLSKIAENDGNADAVSLNDLDAVIQEKEIDLQALLDADAAPQADDAPITNPEVTPSESLPPSQSAPSPTVSPTSNAPASRGSYSGGGSPGAHAQVAQPPANPLDSMSLEQLETEKSNRETTLNEKKEAVNAVNNGSNEKVQAALAEKQKAENDYREAVKKDENISKSLNKDFEKNLQKINENQAKLDDNAVKINNKEVEISTQDETIKSLTAEISALTSQSDSFNKQLASLQDSLSKVGKPSGKPEDAARDAQINAKKQEISAKIEAKKAEIKNKKTEIDAKNKALNAANKKLETLKGDLEKLNVEKSKFEEVKTKLNEEKTTIEEKISKTCSSETKAKMEAYNNAAKRVESVKTSELSSAKAALTEAQSSVQEVNAKINEVKNRKVFDGELNTDNIPAEYRDQISVKTLPNGTQVLTFGYTNYRDLRPEMQDQVALFNEVAAEKGYTFVMSDGFRSIEESNAARARKGSMVAPGGSSPHNYGAAFDCGVYKSGGKGLTRDEWNEFAAEVKKRSNGQVSWGGDFKSKSYEVWHFELSNWKQYKTS